MWVIAVHGGAGAWTTEGLEDIEGCIASSIRTAAYLLRGGGRALDAVVEAVKVLEDCGLFNAGLGSCLTLAKTVEMDAAVMDGEELRAGAVACIKKVKNPILVAKRVMEKTDHVFLSGEWATRFAVEEGFETTELVTERKLAKYAELLKMFESGMIWARSNLSYYRTNPHMFHGTVGAVALDRKGRLAAATSTGGRWLKFPGRIGDTPIIGVGTYADGNVAISASGAGEQIIRVGPGIRAAELFLKGLNGEEIARSVMELITSVTGRNTAGLIVVDRNGSVGMAYNTLGMARGYMNSKVTSPLVGVFENLRPF